MWEEKSTPAPTCPRRSSSTPTPTPGTRRVQVPVHGQGRRLGQQVLPVPGDQGGPEPASACWRSSTRSCARSARRPARRTTWPSSSAAPSAEFALKTAKYALGQLPRRAADDGIRCSAHGFRDLELEAAGARADPQLRHRRPVRRQVLLPRRPRRPPAAPRRLAARSRSRCPAPPTARRWARSPPRASSSSSSRPTRPASCRRPPTSTSGRAEADVVRIDLNRPMDEIRAELSQYPVKTRLSLTGPLVVARDIAHAKIKERLDAGEPMPQYLRDHAVYYAGPAKTPEGYAVGLVRPDDGRADGLLRRAVPGRRRLDGHAGQGQPLRRRSPTPATAHGGFYLGLDRRPGRPAGPGLHQARRGARVRRARHGGGLEDRGRGLPGVHRRRRQGQRLLRRDHQAAGHDITTRPGL